MLYQPTTKNLTALENRVYAVLLLKLSKISHCSEWAIEAYYQIPDLEWR